MSTMGRVRQSRKDLPQRVYHKHGAYYFVDNHNKWHPLGKDYSTDAFAPYPVFVDTGTAVVDKSNVDLYLNPSGGQ